MKLSEYIFNMVCEIKPEMQDGEIFTYNPRKAYDNSKGLRLNKYGNEMFCKFKIPRDLPDEGVYCLTSGEDVVYIGECLNLSQRYNMGYGNISPRNVYVGGQSTNCKVNANILKVVEDGRKVFLYFHRTNDRHNVEAALINEHQPAWNSKQIYYANTTRKNASPGERSTRRNTVMGRMSKYHDLYVYLSNRDEEFVKLTYEKMESIIGGELPPTASNKREWWGNDKYHTQAKAWQDAGYLVDEIRYEEYVVFKKCDGGINLNR